ncbi:MAG: PLxRFG domain-containing protein [Proteobacteria bacterium]|nr:PLxRFG domain-containing protein [Pseudomonadota bacterium]MBU4470315.1 PLxRFG domain-containing protein [Pseudomonadota bacterium]MCG2752727.1 PLxRFG domain-containing protein [Desulfobacteraceae bacterium]
MPISQDQIVEMGKASIQDQRGYDFLGGAKVLATGLPRVPVHMVGKAIDTFQGQAGADVVNPDFFERISQGVREWESDKQAEISEKYKDRKFLPGIKVTDVGSLPENLAYSVNAAGAGIGAGMASSAATGGNLVAGYAAGMAAAGEVAYRGTTYDFMREVLTEFDNNLKTERGSGLTEEEQNIVKNQFEKEATETGLWEALPEAIGGGIGFKILTSPLKGIMTKILGEKLGEKATTNILAKIIGSQAEELSTETITQMGQTDVRGRAGLEGGKQVDWTKAGDWIEALKEVAPQTVLLTAVMGGAIAGGNRVHDNRKIRALDKSIKDDEYKKIPNDEFGNEVLAKTLDYATELQNARPKEQRIQNAVQKLTDEIAFRKQSPDAAIAPEEPKAAFVAEVGRKLATDEISISDIQELKKDANVQDLGVDDDLNKLIISKKGEALAPKPEEEPAQAVETQTMEPEQSALPVIPEEVQAQEPEAEGMPQMESEDIGGLVQWADRFNSGLDRKSQRQLSGVIDGAKKGNPEDIETLWKNFEFTTESKTGTTPPVPEDIKSLTISTNGTNIESSGDETFVRSPSKAENVGGKARQTGFNKIPDAPEGFEKVYKPYGAQGAGYYYARKAEVSVNDISQNPPEIVNAESAGQGDAPTIKENLTVEKPQNELVQKIDSAIDARAKDALFQEEGRKAVPGIRLADAIEAGQMSYLVAKGDATQEEFDAWKATAKAENRIRTTDGQSLDQESPATPSLPTGLSGAKPRYSYGNKQFGLTFENDIDKAAYITAQEKPSKKDSEYLKFVAEKTGLSEDEIRDHGRSVKQAIKDIAAKSNDIEIIVPGHPIVKKTEAAPSIPQLTPKEQELVDKRGKEFNGKRDKAMAEYNAFIASIPQHLKDKIGDVIKENPISPSSQKLRVARALARVTTGAQAETAVASTEAPVVPKPVEEKAETSEPVTRESFTKSLERKGTAVSPDGTSYSIQEQGQGNFYVRATKDGIRTESGGGYPAKWSMGYARQKAIDEAFGIEYEFTSLATGKKTTETLPNKPAEKPSDRLTPKLASLPDGWKIGEGGIFVSPFGEYSIYGQPGEYALTGYGNRIGGTYTNAETAAKAANQHWIDKKQAAEPKAKPAYGEGNKIFTKASADAARERLKKKLGQVSIGIDPEMIQDGIQLAGYHIESGARSFAAYAKAMLEDLGAAVKPYLRGWYEAVRYYPGFENAEEMSTPAEIEAFDKADENAYNKPEESTKGGQDEHSADGNDGKRPLEKSGSENLQEDGETQRSDKGKRSSSSLDDGGDGSLDAGEDDGTGGLAGEQGTIHLPDGEELGGELPSGLEDQQTPVSEPAYLKLSGDNPGNYRITEDDDIGSGTRGQKIDRNLAAIRLVKQLEKEGRYPTQAEQSTLAKYVGWGGLKSVLDKESTKPQDTRARKEIESLLTENELMEAFLSIKTAHYTSPQIIGSMYDILKFMGFKGGNVLEPTYGAGNFIGLMPEDLSASSKWCGSELDPITAKIGQLLYPDSQLIETGFQTAEFPFGKFDLAIGNPPFGDLRVTDNKKSRRAINRFKIHNYVIAKEALHLRPGGILANVVTTRFLDTANPEARDFLANNFKLLTAIRLPNDAFSKNAGTTVTTDLIFLQRLMPDEKPDLDAPWLKTGATMKNSEGEEITLNKYFADNPHMMLGEPSMKGTMYGGGWKEGGRGEFTLDKRDGQDAYALIQNLIKDSLGNLKNVFQERANDKADAAALSLNINKADVGIGGFYQDGNDIFMRGDDDSYGNPTFELLSPGTQWTEKTKLGEKKYGRIKGMLRLREKAYRLIEAERFDLENIEDLRKDLNKSYDNFTEEFGFLSDPANFGIMSDDIKIEFGLEAGFKKAISPSRAKALKIEPSPAIAFKSSLLLKRLYFPSKEIIFAKDVTDGYGISLSQKGRLDVDYVASLTGKTVDEVTTELSDLGLAYKDPETGAWIQDDEYLSGNVKAKHAIAVKEGSGKNAEALEKVFPADKTVEQIFVGLGATWVPENIYKAFGEFIGVENPDILISHETGKVIMHGESSQNEVNVGWLNEDYYIPALFTAAATKKTLIAYDGSGDDRTVNRERTKALSVISKNIKATFDDWLTADEARTKIIVEEYNKTQNTHAARAFNGKHLKAVGASPSISLRNTQKDAAWRMVQSNVVMLDHAVGSGKTYTIITGIMERVRMGLTKKAIICVPNHIVGQWAADWLKLYPGARILAATNKDFSKPNRRRLFSRIATGDHNAIIVGHSSFGFIPLEKEAIQKLILEEIAHLEQARSDAIAAGEKRMASGLADRILKKRERINNLMNKERDNVLNFGQMNIDHLVVDESHEFKNLEYSSSMQNITGMGNPQGSKKAFDLYSKIRYLSGIKNTGVTFATGTPISNSLVEMYAILRYLNRQGLVDRKLEAFDSWASAYATTENKIEYTASQKLKDRVIMSTFNNVKELLQLYNEFADSLTMDDIKKSYSEQIRESNRINGTNEREEFPVPKVDTGGRQLDLGSPDGSQRKYVDYLVARATRLERLGRQADPKEDNHLWIMSDARKMALDIRLVDPKAKAGEDNKVTRSAKKIKEIYDKWHSDKGTQLVFCDLSTPAKTAGKEAKAFIKRALKIARVDKDSRINAILAESDSYTKKWEFIKNLIEREIDSISAHRNAETSAYMDRREALEAFLDENSDSHVACLTTADTGFSVYDDLKATLIRQGIPEGEIRFIHDSNSQEQKKELFGLVNAGAVRVLIGSTPKMGAGTNAQERMVATHHLDAPWRPSDVEQREGRLVRQGNVLYSRDPDNFNVEIHAYSTGNTFDAVMWQILSRKQGMLNDFRSGRDTIVDQSSDSASYADFMAETTGNPAFKEKFKLEAEIEELQAVKRRILNRRRSSEHSLKYNDRHIDEYQESISKAKKVVESFDKEKDQFSYDGKEYDPRDITKVETAERDRISQVNAQRKIENDALIKPIEDKVLALYPDAGTDPDVNKKANKLFDKLLEEAGLKRNPTTVYFDREKLVRHLPEGAYTAAYQIYKKIDKISPEDGGSVFFKVNNKMITAKVTPLEEKKKTADYDFIVDGVNIGEFRDRAGAMGFNAFMEKLFISDIRRTIGKKISSDESNMRYLESQNVNATQTLEKLEFKDQDKLKEKQDRYDKVVSEVNLLEQEMTTKRNSEPNEYISNSRLDDLVDSAGQYSTKSNKRSFENVKAKDIQAIFKGQHVGLSPDGSIWVKTIAGQGLNIKSVDVINADKAAFEIGYGRMKESGDLVSGKYYDSKIELQRDISDKWTVYHEAEHWAEDIGLLSMGEINAINRAIRQGKGKPSAEARAKWIEENLYNRDMGRGSKLGQILQKIRDFIDALVNLAFKTARGVARSFESGKVFDRKGTSAGESPERFRLADKADPNHAVAQEFNEAHPGHDLHYDGVQEMDPLDRPDMYQFTAMSGPAKGATFLADSMDMIDIKEKLDYMVDIRKGTLPQYSIAGERGAIKRGAIGETSINLYYAKDMEKNGASREMIWKETGWWVGPDGKWRFEIDDSKAFINKLSGSATTSASLGKDAFVTLPELLSHDELYKAYPSLKNILVRLVSGSKTASQNGDLIMVGYDQHGKVDRPSLLHEVQHAIQDEEGFASGGNYRSMPTDLTNPKVEEHKKLAMFYIKQSRDETNRLKIKVSHDLARKHIEIAKTYAQFEAYQLLAGEAEARLTQERLKADKNEAPWKTLEKMLKKEGLLGEGQLPEDVLIKKGQTGANLLETIDDELEEHSLSAIEYLKALAAKPNLTRKGKEDLSYFNDLLLSIPAFFKDKIPAVAAMFRATQERQDQYHENVFYLENHNDVNTVKAFSDLRKADQKKYEEVSKYLVNNDRERTGYRIKKNRKGEWKVYSKDNKEVLATFKNEAEAIEAAMKHEAKDLMESGFNPQQVGAVMAFRTSTNKGFDVLMGAMKNLIQKYAEIGRELPPVVTMENGKEVEINLETAMAMMGDMRGYYFPRIRKRGGYVLTAFKGEDKKLLTFGNHFSMNAEKARLEKNGWDVQTSKSKKVGEDVFDMAGELVKTQQIVNAALTKFEKSGDTLADKDIESILNETEGVFAAAMAEQIANVIRERGSRVHMTRRSEDYFTGYNEDPEIVIAEYIRSLSGGEAKREMVVKLLRAFTGTEISWKEFQEINPDADFKDYKNFVRSMMIDQAEQPWAFKWGKAYISEVTRNRELSEEVIGTIKGLAVAKYLAFRVFSAPLVNLTALATSVPASMKGAGIPLRKAPRLLVSAMNKYRMLKFTDGSGLSDEDKQIFHYIQLQGWDNPQFNSEAFNVLKSKLGRGYDSILEKAMFTFSESEKLNRVVTIFAAYKGLKAKNRNLSLDDLMQKAKQVSDDSHGIYNKGNYPFMAMGNNPAAQVAKMFYVFRTFSHTYLLNMRKLGFEQKDYAALAYMLISPAIIAGAGASVAMAIANAILPLFGVDDPEEDLYLTIGKQFGQTAESFARFGVVGAGGHGVSMKGSLSIGIGDMPTSMGELLGAPGSVLSDIFIDGIPAIAKGDVSKGFEKILPTGIGNLFKAYRENSEGITSRTNAPLFFGTEPLSPSPVETFYKTISLNPARIAGIREKQWKEKGAEARMNETKAAIYARLRKFYLGKGRDKSQYAKIMAEIQDFNDEAIARKVSPITAKSIKTNMKRAFRPSRRERLRAVNE